MLNSYATVFSSAARTAATHQSDEIWTLEYRGIRLYLDITAASGTSPTLDLKVQTHDPVSDKWFDMPGATFVQKTTTGTDDLTLYPGIAETANETVSDTVGPKFRVHGTIGGSDTPTFTYSIGAQLLK